MKHEHIDYDLRLHFDIDNNVIYHHGYTIKILTERVVDSVRKDLEFDIEKNVLYRFEDREIYNTLHNYLTQEELHYVGLHGDDSWPLYALRDHKGRWGELFGDKYIEREYPLRGIELWNSCRDLKKIV